MIPFKAILKISSLTMTPHAINLFTVLIAKNNNLLRRRRPNDDEVVLTTLGQ
jgi:hypothetical protein